MMTYKPFGDQGLLIVFEQKISPEINEQVIALARAIQEAKIEGVLGCIPAYCSLTVNYLPTIIGYDTLKERIQALRIDASHLHATEQRRLEIPLCYEPKFALDFAFLCDYHKLSANELIQLHSAKTYRVFMLGFLAGFVYMGILPEALNSPRKKTPRLSVPAGSVGLAGLQTGIYPSVAPGGWQLIGQTPYDIFDANREEAFMFKHGDLVNFYPISSEEFYFIKHKK